MIDLHLHSRYSDDGELTVAELTERCVKQGIHIMAVTDHNCVRANREARQEARGMTVIAGIEIDCVWEGSNFHLLGYGIDSESPDFACIEETIAGQSAAASMEMLRKTQELGFAVTEHDMRELSRERYWKERWTGEMFAEALLLKPEYQEHPLLAPYRKGGMRSDNPYVNFYWDYYAQGKPCHAEIYFPQMEKMIETIHNNHGIAVLAHPGVNLRGREETVQDMLSLGIDGLEAFSSYHTEAQTAYFYRTAKQAGLGITCGSDFHGKTKPSVRPGDICGAVMEREEAEREVMKFLQEKVLTACG